MRGRMKVQQEQRPTNSDKSNARLWSTLRDDETSKQSTSVRSRKQREYWSTKEMISHQEPTAASQGRDFQRSTATPSRIPPRANSGIPKARLPKKFVSAGKQNVQQEPTPTKSTQSLVHSETCRQVQQEAKEV